MPMYEKLKFPASAMMITKELIKIATFELIPTRWLDETIWYFPEEEAFSSSFEISGIESTLLLQNIGFILYLVLLNILLALLHLILSTLKNKIQFVMRIVSRMERYLYFNGSIRLFIELFFDVGLIASLNLHVAEHDAHFPSETASYYLSIIFILMISISPIVILLMTFRKPSLWMSAKFNSRCGTFYEDIDPKKMKRHERALMIIPVMFYLRRVVFIVVVLVFREIIWAQLATQNFIALAMCIHI